jgi:hypothetical protein
VVHEEFRFIEPHRLIGAGLEATGHEINWATIEARDGRVGPVALEAAVVVTVDEKRVATTPDLVASDVIDRAGGDRMQEWLAALK